MITQVFDTVERVVLDPPDCNCTDCMTGYSRPMTSEEYELCGFESRVVRETKKSVVYMSIWEAER